MAERVVERTLSDGGLSIHYRLERLGGDLLLVSHRFDDAANLNRLGGYGLLGLYASTRLTRDWEVLARIDNLADKDYQLARTYATAGRTVYVGVKWAPQ